MPANPSIHVRRLFARRPVGATIRLALTVALLFGLATLSPAPIKDPRAMKTFTPERTDAQRMQDQRWNGTAPVVGSVPLRTERKLDADITSSGEAASVVGSVASPEGASDAVRRAGENLKRKDGPVGGWWLGGLFAILGFGVIYALRAYVERKIEETPVIQVSTRKVRW